MHLERETRMKTYNNPIIDIMVVPLNNEFGAIVEFFRVIACYKMIKITINYEINILKEKSTRIQFISYTSQHKLFHSMQLL